MRDIWREKMIWQIGKNPEFTISAWFDIACWSGDIAIPFNVTWWNVKTADGHKNIDISVHFLCFGFGLDIWKWGEENA